MEKQVAGAEITINAPPETVWHAITDSKIALMPGATVESDWKVGHPITIEGEWNGKHFTDHGEIIDKVEGRRVEFSHWSGSRERPRDYHLVRYEIDDKGGGTTHVALTQTNVGDKPEIDPATKAEYDENWKMMLAHLKKSAEAG